MGAAIRVCCMPAKNTGSTLNEISGERQDTDCNKVKQFKEMVEGQKSKEKRRRKSTIEILREAVGELGLTEEPITNYYRMEKILGSGKYGVVRKGYAIDDPSRFVAIKIIDMKKLSSQFHSLVQEILTLKKVDHPNIVSIHEMFKDEEKLYLVMEHVEGMELFDFVTDRFKLMESEAVEIIEQLVKVIRYLNSLGICHRDLKPENIIINQKTLQIKLIDFGLSAYFDEVNQLRSKVGTPYYVAPEVLDGNYNKECDMWSIGVITYILLVGYPPFNSKSMKIIYDKIRSGKAEFYQSEWENLSKEALDFTNKLLQKSLDKRMTPGQALKHPWITNKESFVGEISTSVLKKLANFRSPDKLKKEIYQFLASNIKAETINQMNIYFHSLDTDKTGLIRIDDVLNKFEELNCRSSRLIKLQELYSQNKDLKINYSDFMTRVLDIAKEVEHDDLIKAFKHFDSDGSGKITKEDLKNLMRRKGENLDDQELDELLKQVDGTSPKVGLANKAERTEINFDTFRNYIYKLSPMSPSLREGLGKRNREENYSIDVCDDDTTHDMALKVTTHEDERSGHSFRPSPHESVDFQVMFDNE